MGLRFISKKILSEFEQRAGFDLPKNAFMVCRRGSRTYGTATKDSDSDYMIVVIPPFERLVGMKQFDGLDFIIDGVDIVVYSIGKYFRLLLKNNPNVMETLWLSGDDYCPVDTSRDFMVLQVKRAMFSSLKAYHTFSGYAYGQLKRMDPKTQDPSSRKLGAKRKALIEKFGYDTKNAAHLIRLFRMGIEFVETGELNVRRPDRVELLNIRNGKWTRDQVIRSGEELQLRMKAAKDNSPLKEQPDFEKIDAFLVKLIKERVLKQMGIRSSIGVGW